MVLSHYCRYCSDRSDGKEATTSGQIGQLVGGSRNSCRSHVRDLRRRAVNIVSTSKASSMFCFSIFLRCFLRCFSPSSRPSPKTTKPVVGCRWLADAIGRWWWGHPVWGSIPWRWQQQCPGHGTRSDWLIMNILNIVPYRLNIDEYRLSMIIHYDPFHFMKVVFNLPC